MNKRPRVLVTCPPMLRMMGELTELFSAAGIEPHCPDVIQTLPESELVELVPGFEGWIMGDDPATRRVFEAGSAGKLTAAVKWGVGVDNVDFAAARELGIELENTPGVFGREVADLAMGYVLALARQTQLIDRGVRAGEWPKPTGISLAGQTVGVVGFGDIGRNFALRALAAEMNVIAYDPRFGSAPEVAGVVGKDWPQGLSECAFLVFTCALTPENRHMLDRQALGAARHGVRIVNVARGPLIDEDALVEALAEGRVHSAALDVFEQEPLPPTSGLRRFESCIFGSHNGSNTVEAVVRASEAAVASIARQLVTGKRP